MAKSDRIRRAHELAAEELRNDPTAKLLLERMAYHRGIMAKERERADRRASAPVWRRLLHLY
ncbi:MAG TPA: hypothetical protein VN770_00030 [Gaiellaceae bacterium]|nr:hypothetical protein [Gaiellaceae bacterium]